MNIGKALVRELLRQWEDVPTQQRLHIYAARKIRRLSWNVEPPEPAEIVNIVHLKILSAQLTWDTDRVSYLQMLYVSIKGEIYKQHAKADQRLVDRADPRDAGAFDNVSQQGASVPTPEDELIAHQELMRFLQSLKHDDVQLLNYALEIMDQNYGERRDHKRIAASLGISVAESYNLAVRLERRCAAYVAGEVAKPLEQVRSKEVH